MDVAAIFALIAQGLSIAEIALKAGQDVAAIIASLKNVASSAQNGSVTDEQLAEAAAATDAVVAKFNEPLE